MPSAALPQWIRPQLTELVDAAPEGEQWLHEIKYDDYRMQARLDHGAVRLLTRTGLDWTPKYPAIARAVAALAAGQAYLDGELCGVGPDGITSFSMIQLAWDAGNAAGLVFFLFDLLHLDGEDVAARPLIERKARLAELLAPSRAPLQYSDHQIGHGPAFLAKACAMKLEAFHVAPWEQRMAIIDRLSDRRMTQLCRRLIFVERPDLFAEDMRLKLERMRARRILGRDGEVPWRTLPQALFEIEGAMSEADLDVMEFLSWTQELSFEKSGSGALSP